MVATVSPHSAPLAVLILGPTGSGKTALSLALGKKFAGEIVSCDSVAVYRGMDLGSAKPTRDEQAQLPHHLIDVANPDEAFTAGEYSKQARAAMQAIADRGHVPIVTGGTGLYLRALTDGLFAGPVRQTELREKLRRSQEQHGGDWLWRVLRRIDRDSAERIHANDLSKLIRAIEVCLTTRETLSSTLGGEGARDPLKGFRLLRIGLNPARAELYERLNRRANAMFVNGLIDETRGLLEKYGLVKALDSLGYRQAMSVLKGEMIEIDAIRAAQQGHRNYAKRQMTWFRREPEVHWFAGFGDAEETQMKVLGLVEENLAK